MSEKIDSFNEKKEVEFKECGHSSVKFKSGELVCECGASWAGQRLNVLYKLLTKKEV